MLHFKHYVQVLSSTGRATVAMFPRTSKLATNFKARLAEDVSDYVLF